MKMKKNARVSSKTCRCFLLYRTQIRHDQDGRCFETNTELCGKDQAKDLKQQWNELNGNITQMCQEGIFHF